ncbi:hypothetical protein M0804_008779 [Polistes exclamans]|nr:hypothetical protein M0804_008779 [Polistes exclamans]
MEGKRRRRTIFKDESFQTLVEYLGTSEAENKQASKQANKEGMKEGMKEAWSSVSKDFVHSIEIVLPSRD